MKNKYSDLKLLHFPDKLKSFRDGVITAPIYVRVKPINVCNHSCWWCCYHSPDVSQMHRDMESRDVIPTPKLMEILDDFYSMGVKAVTFSGGGEPLLHRDIVPVMARALQLGIDLSIITNGSMLSGARAEVLYRAKWVRVSIDYSSEDELHKFRSVPEAGYQQIMDNIKAFAANRKGCDLYVNYIVHAGNCDNLVGSARLLKSLGVDNVRFSPMWVSPGFHEYHARILQKVEAQVQRIRHELVDDKFTINSTYDVDSTAHNAFRTYHRCWFMQSVPVIGADQMVYACHNKAYDATGAIGSIKDQRFSDLWFSQAAKNVFEGLDPVCRCKHQCANDSKNILVEEMLNSSNDNFV
jgi:MoaA/NifB/PqqE/SkfB family radical SAM enzyme